jgi:cytochrome b involved in lipid metabolism
MIQHSVTSEGAVLYTIVYMKKTSIILAITALIILGIGAWAYSNWKTYAPVTYVQETTTQTGTTTSTTVNTETGTSTPGAPSYTSSQVAEHNTATSCYTIISGKVYDLTLWVAMHPGGKAAILSICGIDGTAKFMAQHHGAQKQMDILARFYIGTSAQ